MASVNDPRPLGLQNPVVYREVAIVGSPNISDVTAAPTLSIGSGAPTHTRPNGSIYLRTDGAADTSMYQRIAGAWVSVENTGGSLNIPDDALLTFGDDVDGSIGYADVADTMTITLASADMILSTTTTGNISILPVDDLVITATGSDINIDSATFTADFTSTFSIDGVGASNVTTDNGNLTLATTTAGSVIINAAGDVDMDSQAAMDIDAATTLNLTAVGALGIECGGAFDATTSDVTGLAASGATSFLGITTGQRNLTDALGSPQTGALTIQTGDSIVDNGAGAATGGPSGALILQTGDTNCDDAAGTAGTTGALTVQTGDADSNAGTSGDSGILSLVTGFSDDATSGNVVIGSGAAGTNSGDVYLDVGAAGVTPGNVVIGTTATLIALDGVTKFRAAGGADAASALLAGVGTTGSPATTAVAGANMIEFRVQTTATADDFRGFRLDADFAGVGVSGDAVRGRALITAAGTAGTVDGGAFTAEYNGGSVAGQATGCRSNVVFPNATVNGGTVYGGMSEFALGGTSFVNGLTASALHSFSVIGADAATRNAQVLNLFEVSGVTSTSGGMFYANTAAVPGSADASLRVMCPDGTVRHILLFNNEA